VYRFLELIALLVITWLALAMCSYGAYTAIVRMP